MAEPRIRFDVLRNKVVRTMVQHPAFPLVLQVLTLVIVVTLAVIGLGVGRGMPEESLLTLRKTNLTSYLVWGLWWPAMIIAMVAFGRVWCTICPLELLSRVGDALARKLNLPRLALGRFLRAGWFMLAGYLLLQIGVAFFQLHRMPHHTALLLLALPISALLVGLLFRGPRAYCRAFCPAGAVLSVYGRLTSVQLETRNQDVCDQCSTKDCIKESNRFRFDARSCPSLLRPFDRKASDACVLCFQCAKVCPHDNIGFGSVSAEAPVRRKQLLRPFEAAFVIFAFGFLTHEIVEDVHWGDAVFAWVPEHVASWLHGHTGWMENLWYLGGFQLVFWSLLAAVAYAAGHKGKLRDLFLGAATGAAPVVAVTHLAKATAKIAGWLGYLPGALADPKGLRTFHDLTSGAMTTPPVLFGTNVAGWLGLILVTIMALKSRGWIGKLPKESLVAARVGLVAATLLFATDLALWALGIA